MNTIVPPRFLRSFRPGSASSSRAGLSMPRRASRHSTTWRPCRIGYTGGSTLSLTIPVRAWRWKAGAKMHGKRCLFEVWLRSSAGKRQFTILPISPVLFPRFSRPDVRQQEPDALVIRRIEPQYPVNYVLGLPESAHAPEAEPVPFHNCRHSREFPRTKFFEMQGAFIKTAPSLQWNRWNLHKALPFLSSQPP